MLVNIAHCFDSEVEYPVETYPRSLLKLHGILPNLWGALLSPLPVFDPQDDHPESSGPNLDGLGQRDMEVVISSVADSASVHIEDAEIEALQLQVVLKKRKCLEASAAESSAKQARNILRKKELLAELAALDAPPGVVALFPVPDAKDLELAALKHQVT